MKRLKKALSIVGYLFLALLIILVVYSTVCRIQNKSVVVFGWQVNVVESGSMESTLYKYDLVISKTKDPSELEVGDILIFQRDGTRYVHRLVERDGETLVTKGDANNARDKSITSDAVEGVVVLTIPKIGVVFKFLQSGYGLLAVALFVIGIICFVSLIRYLKNNESHEA